MKILLVGEYSRLHNSLKEGLIKLNHQVNIVAPYDGFKKYDVDFLIKKRYNKGLLKKFKNLLFLLTGHDLESISIKNQIHKLKSPLSNYDIVQFINEAPFGCSAKVEKQIFDAISSWNTRPHLLSCGTDFISVNYANNNKYRYSILTPYKEGKDSAMLSSYGLKFLNPEFKQLHKHIYSVIKGVISSDLDYHIPLINHPKYLGLVANPINTNLLEYNFPTYQNQIVIFHGKIGPPWQ